MSAPKVARWILVIGFALLALYWYPRSWPAYLFIDGLYDALAASLMAISLTVLLIDRANDQRDRRQLKKRLIWEMGSSDQAFAIRAAKEMRDAGWLADGTLEGADLTIANLARAQLSNADLKNIVLSGANLTAANVENADLRDANLEGMVAEGLKARKAKLSGACLRKAKLPNAVLEDVEGYCDGKAVDMLGAMLVRSSMRNAVLKQARLEDCDLFEADLSNCDLSGATLLRANLTRAVLTDVNLERADLSDVQGWSDIASIRNARIGGVRNAPTGFMEWAIEQGALEVRASSAAPSLDELPS